MNRGRKLTNIANKPRLVLERPTIPLKRVDQDTQKQPIRQKLNKENDKRYSLYPQLSTFPNKRNNSVLLPANPHQKRLTKYVQTQQPSKIQRKLTIAKSKEKIRVLRVMSEFSYKKRQQHDIQLDVDNSTKQFKDFAMSVSKKLKKCFEKVNNRQSEEQMVQRVLLQILIQAQMNINSLKSLQDRINLYIEQGQAKEREIGSNSDIGKKLKQVIRSTTKLAPVKSTDKILEEHQEQRKNNKKDVHNFSIKSGIAKHDIEIKREKGQKSEKTKFIFEHINELNYFTLKQPTKTLSQNLQRQSYLEEQLFVFIDVISNSMLEPIKYHHNSNTSIIEQSLKERVGQLRLSLEKEEYSMDEKLKMLSHYTIFVRQSYNILILQLKHIIDQKAMDLKNLMRKIISWKLNYLARKQQLNSFKNQYTSYMHLIAKTLTYLQTEANISEDVRGKIASLQENIVKISHIFLIGNTFS